MTLHAFPKPRVPSSTNPPNDWLAAARALRAQHHLRQRFAALVVDGQPLSNEQGYAVQTQHVAELRRELASNVAGYKIGLTSPAMQQMCGIAHPVYGCVLESRVAQAIGTASLAAHGRLGIEFEIAARLGQDIQLQPGDDALTRATEAVDAFAIALELVDDRLADYACIDAASLIADNAWNAGVVLGPWMPTSHALTQSPGELFVDGQSLDHGCIGEGTAHPLASVAWLAQALGEQGRFLQRGMFVMTGSVVRTRFPQAPGHWRFALPGLGSVGLEVLA